MRRATSVLLVPLAFVAIATTALGQYIPPTGLPQPGRPQLSPYLNLLRGGDTAANYYLGVVPERINRNNFRAIEGNLVDLSSQVRGLSTAAPSGLFEQSPLPPTGHRTYYGSPRSSIGQATPALTPSLMRNNTPPAGAATPKK